MTFVRGAKLTGKLARRTPSFTMRTPDPNPPFHGDNDACYLCNPVDLVAYFKGKGWRVERKGKPGRPSLVHLFVTGTWVTDISHGHNEIHDIQSVGIVECGVGSSSNPLTIAGAVGIGRHPSGEDP